MDFLFLFTIFATMDKSRINDMVDRKITEAFRNGVSIGAVKSDLIVRMSNFKKTITYHHT